MRYQNSGVDYLSILATRSTILERRLYQKLLGIARVRLPRSSTNEPRLKADAQNHKIIRRTGYEATRHLYHRTGYGKAASLA